jgi:hypothetical protein
MFLAAWASSCDGEAEKARWQWKKTEFQNQGSIYAIHGSLEGDMLLGTGNAILKLYDMGARWEKVLDTDYAITGIWLEDDTLYATTAFINYFSTDHGEHWLETDKPVQFIAPELRDLKNVLYRIVSLSNGELITPGLVLRSGDNGTNWENIFPYKKMICSARVDSHNRLYIGTNGFVWNETAGSFEGSSADAELYILE